MEITRTGQQSQSSLNGKLAFEQDNNRIVGRDSNDKIRLLINSMDEDFSMKIAKPGFDATDATDAQLIFNSSQNVFKIVASGTASKVISSLAQDATDTLTVPHSLGYIPAAIIYLNGTGSTYLAANRYYPAPIVVPIKVGATYYPGIIYNYSIDAMNIYFTVENRSALTPITDIGTTNWRYYLLQETAN